MRSAKPTLLIASLAGAAALAGSPTAVAQSSCVGRPGASALEQYCEAVPNAEGGRQTPGRGGNGGSGSGGNGSNGSSGAGVSGSSAAVLGRAGQDGAAVERLAGGSRSGAATNASDDEKRSGKGKGKDSEESSAAAAGAVGNDGTGGGAAGSSGADVELPKNPSGSPLAAARNAVQEGPVTGSGVVWALVSMSALGALSALLLRRRGVRADLNDDAS